MHKERTPQNFWVMTSIFCHPRSLVKCTEPKLVPPPLLLPLFDLIKELHSIYRLRPGFFCEVFPLIRIFCPSRLFQDDPLNSAIFSSVVFQICCQFFTLQSLPKLPSWNSAPAHSARSPCAKTLPAVFDICSP